MEQQIVTNPAVVYGLCAIYLKQTQLLHNYRLSVLQLNLTFLVLKYVQNFMKTFKP